MIFLCILLSGGLNNRRYAINFDQIPDLILGVATEFHKLFLYKISL